MNRLSDETRRWRLSLPDREVVPFHTETYLWGYRHSSTGEVLMEPRYHYAEPFCDGLAQVRLDGRYGCIDKAGDAVIPLRYDEMWECSEGLFRVVVDRKHGFVDRTGREAVPLRYDWAYPFKNGLARVQLDGRWGCVDASGKELIPLQYDFLWYMEPHEAAPRPAGYHGRLLERGVLHIYDRSGKRIE